MNEPSELSAQQRRQIVQQIHDSPARLVLSVAGGSLALSDLQTAPGASRTLLEGLAPYTGGSIRALVGEEPMPHVSEDGVITLAQACLSRAIKYAADYDEEFPVIGVSCTAALATQRQRRGDDRAWMAIAALATGVTATGATTGTAAAAGATTGTTASPDASTELVVNTDTVVKTRLVEFATAEVVSAKTTEGNSTTDNPATDNPARDYYTHRMTQERQLADALLEFIVGHVAS